MINASNGGICVEFEQKTTQPWFNFSNCRQVLKSFKTNPLNIIFDEFSICLLGYRTKFSCLYLPQGHNFISTVWLGSTDEYVLFYLERNSIFKQICKSGIVCGTVFNAT